MPTITANAEAPDECLAAYRQVVPQFAPLDLLFKCRADQ